MGGRDRRETLGCTNFWILNFGGRILNVKIPCACRAQPLTSQSSIVNRNSSILLLGVRPRIRETHHLAQYLWDTCGHKSTNKAPCVVQGWRHIYGCVSDLLGYLQNYACICTRCPGERSERNWAPTEWVLRCQAGGSNRVPGGRKPTSDCAPPAN